MLGWGAIAVLLSKDSVRRTHTGGALVLVVLAAMLREKARLLPSAFAKCNVCDSVRF